MNSITDQIFCTIFKIYKDKSEFADSDNNQKPRNCNKCRAK